MINLDKYISDNIVQRSKIARDVSNGKFTLEEIHKICLDKRVKKSFIGNSYDNKVSKGQWNLEYLDREICVAVAESFNEDYLLYLLEVGEYVRNKKLASKNKMKNIIWITVAAIVVVILMGIVIWRIKNTGR